MKGKFMSKGALVKALAAANGLKPKAVKIALDTLASVATKEVKAGRTFTIPGLARLKTRTKPATKAGKREIFGKVVMVKAKPAKKVVKAFPAKAIKDSL